MRKTIYSTDGDSIITVNPDTSDTISLVVVRTSSFPFKGRYVVLVNNVPIHKCRDFECCIEVMETIHDFIYFQAYKESLTLVHACEVATNG